MSDERTTEQAIDPVAVARARLAGSEASSDEVTGLKRQVRALWIMTSVTLVLVIVLAAFSFLPRLFGVRTFGGPDFQGRGRFGPGMQQGTGQQGTGQTGQTTP